MKKLQSGMKLFYSLLFALTLTGVNTSSLAAPAKTDQTIQTRTSSNSTFTVTIESQLKPLQLGRIHTWKATVHDAEGKPVMGADIKAGGGMPIHNHGFPTEPEVTRQQEAGVYLIEGIKFSMSGPWVLFLEISLDGETDSVAFDIDL